jgi:hypothetical protein
VTHSKAKTGEFELPVPWHCVTCDLAATLGEDLLGLYEGARGGSEVAEIRMEICPTFLGRIEDASGKPAMGVLVVAEGPERWGGPWLRHGRTDAGGRFELGQMLPGSYGIVVFRGLSGEQIGDFGPYEVPQGSDSISEDIVLVLDRE